MEHHIVTQICSAVCEWFPWCWQGTSRNMSQYCSRVGRSNRIILCTLMVILVIVMNVWVL